jgi:hypothetical protein
MAKKPKPKVPTEIEEAAASPSTLTSGKRPSRELLKKTGAGGDEPY